MKKLFSSLFVIGLGLSLNAQTGMKIVTTTSTTVDDPDMQAQLNSYGMGESKSTQYIEGNKYRVESGSAFFSVVVIGDEDKDSSLMLLDISMAGQKIAVYMTEEEAKQQQEMRENKDSIVETEVASKKKKVMGHECTVVTKVTADDYEQKYWVATDMDTPFNREITDGVSGLILKSDIEMEGKMMGGVPMYVNAEVTEMEEQDVDDALFEMIVPEGYTLMTYEEYMEQMKKWGRG